MFVSEESPENLFPVPSKNSTNRLFVATSAASFMICSRHAAGGEVMLTRAESRAQSTLLSENDALDIRYFAVSLNVFISGIEDGNKGKKISKFKPSRSAGLRRPEPGCQILYAHARIYAARRLIY